MARIIDYDQIEARLLRATARPMEVIAVALDLNMRGAPRWAPLAAERLAGVVKAGHTTCLEFVDYTFLLQGVSKSLVGQLTRHRMSSFSSTSQHYQLFRDRGFTIDMKRCHRPAVGAFLDEAERLYSDLVAEGVPREEARQLLPTGSTQSILFKANARSLANLFALRLCRRNCREFVVVAWKMRRLASEHCPELWAAAGLPGCLSGGCSQGGMSCGRPYWKAEENG